MDPRPISCQESAFLFVIVSTLVMVHYRVFCVFQCMEQYILTSIHLRECCFLNPGHWNLGNFFIESEILSFGNRNTAQGIQIPLTIGIRNPSFTDKIQYMSTLNPEPAARESRIGLSRIPSSVHHTYLNTM